MHNVVAKVKELENKYMDLANFYKEAAKEKGAKFYSKSSDKCEENTLIRDLVERRRMLEELLSSTSFSH